MLRRQPKVMLGLVVVAACTPGACRWPRANESQPTHEGPADVCAVDSTKATITLGALHPTHATGDVTEADALRVGAGNAVALEVNAACGPFPFSLSDRPLGVAVKWTTEDPAMAAAYTQEVIDLGAIAVVSTAMSIPSVGAVPTALANSVPFGLALTQDARLSGCTQAELSDPAVTKSDAPVSAPGQCFDHRGFVFRAGPTTSMWSAAAAEHLHRAYPWLTRAALLWQDNANGAGAETRDSFQSRFESHGGILVADPSVGGYPTMVELKALIKEAAASEPEVFCLLIRNLSQFMAAYVDLRDDPTWTERPAGFANVRILFVSENPGDDYRASFDAGSLDVLVNQAEGIESAIDASSVEWQKLHALLAPMYLEAPYFEMAARIYDSMLVLAMALAKAGVAEGPAIAAEIRNVANPPGELVYPGEFAKAKALLAAGQDIDYVGAGFADIDERGDATGITWGVWVVSPDGTIQRNVDLFQVQP